MQTPIGFWHSAFGGVLHTFVVPPLHWPFASQVSPVVQAFLSSHTAPVFGAYWHEPATQAPTVLKQPLGGVLQVLGVPPQPPTPLQTSFTVQGSPSSQAVIDAADTGGWVQAPVALQTSAVQGLLSLAHAAPGLKAYEHDPPLQLPAAT